MKSSALLATYALSLALCGMGLAQSGFSDQGSVKGSLSMETCPEVTSLVQMADTSWIAPNGWKSIGITLYHALDRFEGAQWIGVNVGEVICIYHKAGKSGFPVKLQRSIITLSPAGGAWTSEQGGHKDCKANDPAQCPFNVKIATPSKNVYDELDFSKNRPDSGSP